LLRPYEACSGGGIMRGVVEGRLEHVDAEYINAHIAEAWGWPVITVVRSYAENEPLHGLVWRDEWGEIQGLITWFIEGEWAEIVTLDAYQQGRHIGGRLVDGAVAELRERGVRTLSVTTTNDNLRALSFYVRRGFRLVKLELDGMEQVRAVKPGVPLEGQEGLPLRDMLELVREL
jgi:ribosomal protein S18 acetylase RimI-like enzyme